MIESFDYKPEELDETSGLRITSSLSDNQLDYIQEVIPLDNQELLVDRIDEMFDSHPPKALDANKELSELIDPIKEQLDTTLLEAPSDTVQIEQISDVMCDVEGLNYNEWRELSFSERVDVLNEVESKIAEIEHRPASPVLAKRLGEKTNCGFYNTSDKVIVINSELIASNSSEDYYQSLDTLIHEGRHAYQDYNLNVREVHPRQGELTNWKENEFEHGYRDVSTYGFEAYAMQPVETDARAFAEDVIKQYTNKVT